jgi:excisionase family DNA binding protein
LQPKTREPVPMLLTKSAVCRMAGVSMPTVDAEIAAGRLRVTRIRRRTMVHPEDFHAWLDHCRGVTAEGPKDAA